MERPLYRLSDFFHVIRVNQRVTALYNALTFGILFVSTPVAKHLRRETGGVWDPSDLPIPLSEQRTLIRALRNRRLIFPLNKRGDLQDYLRTQKLLRNRGALILYLLVADGCNLACKYCYIERPKERERPWRLMDLDTAIKAIDTFAGQLDPHLEEPQIIFYGGEPLLNQPLILAAIDYIQSLKQDGRLPTKTGITLNTNGLLLNDTFLKAIKASGMVISVSLDGEQSIQDAMRPRQGGQGSFDGVIAGIERVKNADVPLGLSITINRHNITRLSEILQWAHDTFGVRSIGFNILVDRTTDLMGMDEQTYAKMVTEELIRSFQLSRTLGVYEDRIMRKVDAFIDGYPYLYDCGAPGAQMVVTTDAQLLVCQGYDATRQWSVPLHEFGSTRQKRIWNQWSYRSPLFQRQCYSCVALGLCGGGCPYSAERKHGSVWETDDVFCIHAKGTLNYLIQELYQKMQAS